MYNKKNECICHLPLLSHYKLYLEKCKREYGNQLLEAKENDTVRFPLNSHSGICYQCRFSPTGTAKRNRTGELPSQFLFYTLAVPVRIAAGYKSIWLDFRVDAHAFKITNHFPYEFSCFTIGTHINMCFQPAVKMLVSHGIIAKKIHQLIIQH